MNRIKLLVVDDSILFREVLARYIKQDDMIEVVGKAGDAYSARDMILQYEPDVMTLDLEMPRMDGVAFLKKLLPQYYISTIVVSSSEERKEACKEAGAVEFLSKPAARTSSDMADFAVELCKAVRRAYKHSNPNADIESEPSFGQSKPEAAAEPAHVHAPEPKPAPVQKPAASSAASPKPSASASSSASSSASTAAKPSASSYQPRSSQSTASASSYQAPQSPAPKPSYTSAASSAPKPQSGGVSSNLMNAAQFAQKAQAQVTQTKNTISQQTPKPAEAPPPVVSTPAIKRNKLKKSEAIIALGASTGGTEALEQVIRLFPADTPPVIIVQHMPAGFTKLYSERLNRSCKMEVKEAEDGDRLRRGLIIVGAGEHHLRLCKDSMGYYVSSKPGEKVSGHCPSVDVMFTSVAEVAGPISIGAILTGMGRDGADGLLKMRQAGSFTIGQDKETCVVYGMPMEAYNLGAVEVQAPLYKIAEIILNNLY